MTTAAGTSPVDTAKDSFTHGTNLALPATGSAINTLQNLPDWAPSKAIDGNEETPVGHQLRHHSGNTGLDLAGPGVGQPDHG